MIYHDISHYIPLQPIKYNYNITITYYNPFYMTPFGEIPHALRLLRWLVARVSCKVPRFFEKFQGDASRHAFEARSLGSGKLSVDSNGFV